MLPGTMGFRTVRKGIFPGNILFRPARPAMIPPRQPFPAAFRREGAPGSESSERSDIDIAIADVDYFARLDADIRQWELRQRLPHPKAPTYQEYAKRQLYRSFNCVADDLLPRNTCFPHRDAMATFDTTPYCGVRRRIGAFVFRDGWSLRNRCEHDLEELRDAVDEGRVPPPDDDGD